MKVQTGDKVRVTRYRDTGHVVGMEGKVTKIVMKNEPDYPAGGHSFPNEITGVAYIQSAHRLYWNPLEDLLVVKSSRKIIGYKTPIALFNSIIPKDTIYVLSGTNKDIYVPKENKFGEYTAYYSLPLELVEANWEPMFEQPTEEVIIIGSREDKITITKERVTIAVSGLSIIIDIETLKTIWDQYSRTFKRSMMGYDTYIPLDQKCIRIGCVDENHLFSLEEIKRVLDIYNKFRS